MCRRSCRWMGEGIENGWCRARTVCFCATRLPAPTGYHQPKEQDCWVEYTVFPSNSVTDRKARENKKERRYAGGREGREEGGNGWSAAEGGEAVAVQRLWVASALIRVRTFGRKGGKSEMRQDLRGSGWDGAGERSLCWLGTT